MCHFATAAEAHGDLKAIAVLQELDAALELDIEVVKTDTGSHANLLNLGHVLVAAGFFIPLDLLKAVLPVVHNLANGRVAARGDFHEVKLTLDGDLKRRRTRHYAELFSVVPDEANLFIADFFVDLIGRSADADTPPFYLGQCYESPHPFEIQKSAEANRTHATTASIPKATKTATKALAIINRAGVSRTVRTGLPFCFILLGYSSTRHMRLSIGNLTIVRI
jgi:hypothetical protein